MTDSLAARPYFRTPVISPDGTRIAFVYATDIWLVDSEGGDAERLTAHYANNFSPRWSPDGQQLAFASSRTGGGDIYVLPLAGGEVRRLTNNDFASTPEAWSGDGQHIFFSSFREQQNSAIYRISAQGGTPILWAAQPYERLDHLTVSPDNSLLAFNVSRDQWWRRGPNPYGGAEIWVVSNEVDADDYRKISTEYTGSNRWPMWAPDAQGLYFVSDRDGAENIWYKPIEGGDARKVTDFTEGRVLWPTLSANGRTLVFERDFGIWRMDLVTGLVNPLHIHVRADTKVVPVRVQTYGREFSELSLAPDGKKVAFVVRGEVFVDFADKETDKERRQGPSFRVTNTPHRESDVEWSPDSRALVYISDRHGDEEVFQYDFTSRAETRLTDSSGSKAAPLYSPDGSWIAYVRGDEEIRLLNTATKEDKPFVRANFTRGVSLAWSPDSRWLVFTAQDNHFFSNLYVQRIDEQQAHQISFLSNLSAYRPLWSPDGQFILFTTGQYRAEAQIARIDLRPPRPQFREEEFEKLFAARDDRRPTADDRRPAADEPAKDEPPVTGEAADAPQPTTNEEPAQPQDESALQSQGSAQKPPPAKPPIEIEFTGIQRRLRFLTPTQLDASVQCISPDGRDMIFSATVAGKSNLWALPLDEPRQDQPPRQLTGGGGWKGAAQFTPEGKAFFYLDNGQIFIRKFPTGEQTFLPISADVVVDFHQEKLQVFNESWRILRDRFYDPTFRGLDWSVAKNQFEPLAAGAQTTNDLRTILNLMVGELRASHMGAYPGRGGHSEDGYIGLLFDRAEQASTGRLRITAIMPYSPAELAGSITIGDYLLAVNDIAISGNVSLDTLLERTVGRRVRLRIGQPGGESHEVAVRPISADQYNALRYRNWVYANEAYVHRVSNGRLGYVHIREMSYPAYQQFLADLDVEAHSAEGVVVDARFNGGGHTATFILDVLARRSVLLSTFRDRPATDAAHLSGNRVLNKPTVLVINEGSGSNTEMFAEGYRRMGLGKIVGRPTAGAVIWTHDRMLLDGTRFRLPSLKVATPEGEDLEGTGRAVDIDVTLPLGASARGQDTQLDAAVAALLEQIDES